MKIHFLSHLESFMCKRKFENRFFKNILYNPLMGCSPFANYRFQMGVAVMGFADQFGPCLEASFMSCFFASLFYPTLFSGHPSHIGLVSSYYCLIDFSWLGLGPRAIRKLLFLSSAFVAEPEEEKLFYLVPFYHQKCKKRNLIDS